MELTPAKTISVFCYNSLSIHDYSFMHLPRLLPSSFLALVLVFATAGPGFGAGKDVRETTKRGREVIATVTAHDVEWDAAAKKADGPAAVIEFDLPAAPLALVGKAAPAGAVKMTPDFPGVWKWVSSQALAFEPQGGWLAPQIYKIRLDPAALAPDTTLKFPVAWFRAEPLSATFDEATFYIDPTTPALQQTVTTVTFSQPVARDEVVRHLSVTNRSGLELFAPGAKPQVIADEKNPLRFFIRSPLIKPLEKEDLVVVSITPGLRATAGGEPLAKAAESKINVPSRYSNFFFKQVRAQIIQNEDGEPRQFVILESSVAANSTVVAQAAQAWELPPPLLDKDGKVLSWTTENVTPDVLTKSKRVPLEFIAEEGAPATASLFSFKIAPQPPATLYVLVPKETPAPGGFAAREDFAAVMALPGFAKTAEVMGKGGILALNGERKLSVKSRGFDHLRFTLGRVPAAQINHLVSQTGGRFEAPEFEDSFGWDNMARFHQSVQPIAKKNDYEANYSAFDFAPALAKADDGEHGLFALEIEGVRARTPEDGDAEKGDPDPAWIAIDDDGASGDSRFVLITDLGLIVKHNADGTRAVFVQSFKERAPVAGVHIIALAKNGDALAEADTDAQGRASLPALDDLRREKKAVAITARKGADLAFIPWARSDRELDYTRFDVEGVPASVATALDAFLFTERGIYRPGDPIKLGAIVRQRNWEGNLAGLPVEVVLTNAKEEEAGRFPATLPADGFLELTLPTAETAPTGVWRIELRRPDDGKKKPANDEDDEDDTRHLGSMMVRVEEFQPDRMKMIAKLDPSAEGVWLSPEKLAASVELQTLFGIAAADRRVTAKLNVAPGAPHFEQWPGWTFSLPKHERFEPREVDLGEVKTDADGRAMIPLALEAYAAPLLRITVDLEGFEPDGGRGVRSSLSALVSPQPRLLGWKGDGDLSFVARDVVRSVQLMAIGRDGKPTTAPNLKRVLVESRHTSVLTKQESGSFAYVSREQDKDLESAAESLPAELINVALPTNRAGRFRYEWRDEEGVVLCAIPFNVVGAGEQARNMERDAELEMTLPDKLWRPGEQIEISLRAPFAGAGLITIEREKVLAAQWFKSDSASSVQRITVPEGIEGGAYVNVACVRALDSSEIFTSPLSTGVAPFRVAPDRRVLAVTLDAPERVRPGERVKIGFSTARPGRVVVWAVDEGIHRVTSYRTPQPLAKLLRKPSLEVETWQLLDLLMPEYSMLKNARAFGGDGDEEPPELKLGLNPFKRKRNAPVVFWSGIVESGPERREVAYDVPDYFAGRLNIFAMAVAPDAVGVAEKQTVVKGPLVLTPNTPFFVAPGDEFTASLTVANQLEGAEITDQVNVAAEVQGGLEIIESPQSPVVIAPGKEATVRFRVRALSALGNAELKFSATAGKERVEQRATMSVRPGTPRAAAVQSGWFRKDEHDVKVGRDFYSEFVGREAVVSTTPLGLARGLAAYLREYPHGCSEQIVSRGFPWLVLREDAEFGLDRKDAEKAITDTIALLRLRQSEDGGFGYWTSWRDAGRFDYVSVYVAHFLTEAKASGFHVPGPMFDAALRRLRLMADAKLELAKSDDVESARRYLRSEANIQAAAIYLLTRNEEVTTNYALTMRDALESQLPAGMWHRDPSAAWLAATWRLLKKDDEAKKLIALHRTARAAAPPQGDHVHYYYETALTREAMTFTVLCRHFPEIAGTFGYDELRPITEAVERGDFHTLSAAWTVLALKSYAGLTKNAGVRAGITELVNGEPKPLAAPRAGMLSVKFGVGASHVRFFLDRDPGAAQLGAWYQTIETGFDRQLPAAADSSGLEVFREFLDESGQAIETAKVGETVRVRVTVRNISKAKQPNLALSELLPGAFDFAPQSEPLALKPGLNTLEGAEYVDVREDRALIFCGLDENETRTFEYAVRPTCAGSFAVPPTFAESMYDRTVRGRGAAAKFSVLPRE